MFDKASSRVLIVAVVQAGYTPVCHCRHHRLIYSSTSQMQLYKLRFSKVFSSLAELTVEPGYRHIYHVLSNKYDDICDINGRIDNDRIAKRLATLSS